MIRVRQNHCISTDARVGMRRCILVVAQQIEMRARIARVLHSAGYAVELAESEKRALEVVTGEQILQKAFCAFDRHSWTPMRDLHLIGGCVIEDQVSQPAVAVVRRHDVYPN